MTVTVNEDGPQTPPIANDDFVSAPPNTTTMIEVTSNDFETEGDPFTITEFTQPSNGTVTLVDDDLIFTPNTNFVGTDTLTYTICDDDGCDTATVIIFVEGEVQLPPVAVDDNATTDENTAVTIDVTANDVQTNGDPFTLDSFTQPTNGTVTQVGDSLVYTPNTNFAGTDTFTYTICDDDGCDTATVTVTVTEVICENQTEYCIPPAPQTGSTLNICANFCNVPDATLTAVQSELEATITLLADNCFTFTPLVGLSEYTDTFDHHWLQLGRCVRYGCGDGVCGRL